jgi:hypothetical protein
LHMHLCIRFVLHCEVAMERAPLAEGNRRLSSPLASRRPRPHLAGATHDGLHGLSDVRRMLGSVQLLALCGQQRTIRRRVRGRDRFHGGGSPSPGAFPFGRSRGMAGVAGGGHGTGVSGHERRLAARRSVQAPARSAGWMVRSIDSRSVEGTERALPPERP